MITDPKLATRKSAYMNEAIRLRLSIKDADLTGADRVALAQDYCSVGRPETALSAAEAALPKLSKTGDASRADLYSIIGNIYCYRKQYGRALAAYDSAISIYKESHSYAQVARVLKDRQEAIEQSHANGKT